MKKGFRSIQIAVSLLESIWSGSPIWVTLSSMHIKVSRRSLLGSLGKGFFSQDLTYMLRTCHGDQMSCTQPCWVLALLPRFLIRRGLLSYSANATMAPQRVKGTWLSPAPFVWSASCHCMGMQSSPITV